MEQLTTEALVGCFADNIGRAVALDVKRGRANSLRLSVTPERAE